MSRTLEIPPPVDAAPSTAGFRPFALRDMAWIVVLTVVAAALRFYELGEWAFWIDEAHTFRDATSRIDEFWNASVSRYPVAYLTLRGLLDWLPGTSEGWLRLPFAFFGVLTVPVLALVGRSLVGRRASLCSAGLLAVFPWHIYWSQNARGYTITLFFALLGAAGVLRGIQRRSYGWSLAGLLCVFGSGMTHPSGFLLLPAFVAYAALRWRHDEWLRAKVNRYTVGLAVVGVAVVAAVVGPSLGVASRVKDDPSLMHFVQTCVYFVTPPIGLAGLAGLLWLRADARARDGAGFLLCWVGVPLGLLSVVGGLLTKVTAQYAFFTLPAFCLGAGALVVQLADRITDARARLARLVLPLILFADLLSYDYLYFTAQFGDRPRWRDAALLVMAEPGTPVILTTNDRGLDYYVSRDRFWGGPGTGPRVVPLLPWDFRDAGGPVPYLEGVVAQSASDQTTAYIVTTEPELTEKDPGQRIERWLREHAQQIGRFPAWTGPKDMTVFVWRLPREVPPR